jgi:hypothetical protein
MGFGLSVASLIACQQGPSRANEWAEISKLDTATPDGRGPGIVSDGELKSYLPERLGDRPGGAPHGSTTRIGERVLSEVTRSYAGEGEDVELRLSDARLSPQVTQAISSMGGSDDPPGSDASRLVLPAAIGYARYDEGERMALAQVVVAGRFIASATVNGAKGPDEAADALRALDTLRLARAAQSP